MTSAWLTSIFPDLNKRQINQLEQFADLVKEWNQRVNLVSRSDSQRLWTHHLLPSVIPLQWIPIPENRWVLDIGSGGGFPAIPLKIMRPDLQFLLVDSIRKKKLFLQEAITRLQLSHISVVNRRVEALGEQAEFQNRFDLVTARAVAPISQLLDWGRPFLRNPGRWLLWKGSSDIPELRSAAPSPAYAVEIFAVPAQFRTLSPKFADLRFFLIECQNHDTF